MVDPSSDTTAAETDATDFALTRHDLRAVQEFLDEGRAAALSAFLDEHDYHAADIAELIDKLDADHRRALIAALGAELDPEIFTYVHDSVRSQLMHELPARKAAEIIDALDSDDALDLLLDVEPDQRLPILRQLSASMRTLVEEGLTFPEDSAGRLLQREFLAFPEFWTVGKLIDYLRAAGDSDAVPVDFWDIYIIDPLHRPLGVVHLSHIMRARRSVKLGELVASEDFHVIPATMDQEQAALLVRRYGLLSAPVVDDAGRLIGVLTADDIADVIAEEAEEDILALGGVQETDLHAAVWRTARSRFSWLAVNLLTAIAASVVIGMFEATIQQLVALAVLMPIVASMGGNAGTQTLTVAVRALATRELSGANALKVIGKETLVGAINGALFAVITGLVAGLWFRSLAIGGVIAAAMIVNLLVAGLAGASIPLVLDRLKIDPAVASSVFLTTVTDVVGFLAFLGLASWVMT